MQPSEVVAIAFGPNYFHNLGGTAPKVVPHCLLEEKEQLPPHKELSTDTDHNSTSSSSSSTSDGGGAGSQVSPQQTTQATPAAPTKDTQQHQQQDSKHSEQKSQENDNKDSSDPPIKDKEQPIKTDESTNDTLETVKTSAETVPDNDEVDEVDEVDEGVENDSKSPTNDDDDDDDDEEEEEDEEEGATATDDDDLEDDAQQQQQQEQQQEDEEEQPLQVCANFFTSQQQWEKENDPLTQIACSSTATLFLTNSGKVYCTGTIHGMIRQSPSRTIVKLPLKCVQLAAGRHFCLARMEGGLAVCSWGAGHFGQLGLGDIGARAAGGASGQTITCIDQPTVIEGLLPHIIGAPVKQIAAGAWHGMALSEAGHVWSWGCNRSHQCGRKRTNGSTIPTIGGGASATVSMTPPTILSPQMVPVPNGTKMKKIACGRAHSVSLDEKGSVYCWGASNYGQCAGQSSRRRGGVVPPRPVDVLSKLQIVDIAAGDVHTLAMTGGGRVFGWGGNSEGQLGVGQIFLCNPKPKLITDLDFVAIEASREKWKPKQKRDIKPSQYATTTTTTGAADTANGGSLTSSAHSSSLSASPISALSSVPKIISVHACGNYSAAISSSGHVYTWGNNDVGTLGLPVDKAKGELPYCEPGLPTIPVTATTPAPENTQSTTNATATTAMLRQCHVQNFDSSHNVAIPQRVDCISNYHITSVGVGPTHLWCLGKPRPSLESSSESPTSPSTGATAHSSPVDKKTNAASTSPTNDPSSPVTVGRTMYEIQESRRKRRQDQNEQKQQQQSKDGSKSTATKSPSTPKAQRKPKSSRSSRTKSSSSNPSTTGTSTGPDGVEKSSATSTKATSSDSIANKNNTTSASSSRRKKRSSSKRTSKKAESPLTPEQVEESSTAATPATAVKPLSDDEIYESSQPQLLHDSADWDDKNASVTDLDASTSSFSGKRQQKKRFGSLNIMKRLGSRLSNASNSSGKPGTADDNTSTSLATTSSTQDPTKSERKGRKFFK